MKFIPDLTIKVAELEHYSLKKILSFNCKYNYITGARGYGKTYDVKSFCIRRFVKYGEKFAWCRVTDKALEKIKSTEQFFGRLKNLSKLGVKSYKVVGDCIYINDQIAGYFFSVNTFFNIKGADYVVTNIVFDEFMRADGERQIKNKRQKFMDLVESVGRFNAGRVFLISNATNPYDEMLAPFKLKFGEFGCYVFREQSAVIHYAMPSPKYTESRNDSASVIGMSEQEKKMAFRNEFTDFGDYGSVSKGVYMYTLQIGDNSFLSIYVGEGKFMITTKVPDCPKMYTLSNAYVNAQVKKLNPVSLRALREYHDNGLCLFENGYCRNSLQSLLYPNG